MSLLLGTTPAGVVVRDDKRVLRSDHGRSESVPAGINVLSEDVASYDHLSQATVSKARPPQAGLTPQFTDEFVAAYRPVAPDLKIEVAGQLDLKVRNSTGIELKSVLNNAYDEYGQVQQSKKHIFRTYLAGFREATLLDGYAKVRRDHPKSSAGKEKVKRCQRRFRQYSPLGGISRESK